MPDSRQPERWDRGPVANIWQRTLSQIPSAIGRLQYLGSLRDANSGTYFHQGLASIYGEEAAENGLREAHHSAFSQWLNLTTQEKKEDLELYLNSLEPTRVEVLRTWAALAPYRNFVPDAARREEKDLFVLDVEALLEVLRCEAGVSCPDPDA